MSSSIQAHGVLQLQPRGNGFLRDFQRSFQPAGDDVRVGPALIRQFGLVEGCEVTGVAQRGQHGPELTTVERICDLTPEQWSGRTRFERLVAINPYKRLEISKSGLPAMRLVELIAPIGLGTRMLIAAPPKSGKTILLEQLATAIHSAEPEARLILLLIDERPEEVTHFRRSVPGEVLASSNDQSIDEHVALTELTMAWVRCQLECGRHVILLIDSLTRLARAFNLNTGRGGASRTLSGGLDARALEMPRRLFGLARTIEHGGSVTVIATALVDTGSRMDDYIYEEFKSTGNSELMLDRGLAEARIYPAIHVSASGTRKEELLYTAEQGEKLALLRRALAGRDPARAVQGLLRLFEKSASNDELLQRLKAKA